MTSHVVDASVAIKWYVPEIHSADALQLRAAGNELNVPSLFYLEIANALSMKVRKGELDRADAESIFAELTVLPLVHFSDAALAAGALSLAFQTQRSVYDCTYLALAVQLGAKLVTADQRFYNALSNTPWAKSICWIENIA